jgi:hypothetical protein
MQGPAKIATYLGVSMVLLGFAMIAFAWNGAAELDFIQGQFPYALSGGLGGLGLIIGGMAVLAIQIQRTITAERARDMRALQDEADALIRNLIRPAPGEVIEDETIIDVGNRTVIRTIDRRPAEQAAHASPSAEAGAAAGYAPKPRAASGAHAAGDAAAVTVLDRTGSTESDDSGETEDEAAWAPPPTTDEADAIKALLADVSGVGPAKQNLLAERFGTVAALRSASVDELAAVPGISRTLASRIQRAVG